MVTGSYDGGEIVGVALGDGEEVGESAAAAVALGVGNGTVTGADERPHPIAITVRATRSNAKAVL